MNKILQYLPGDESGASAAEYALILALVAIAPSSAGLTVLGTTINTDALHRRGFKM